MPLAFREIVFSIEILGLFSNHFLMPTFFFTPSQFFIEVIRDMVIFIGRNSKYIMKHFFEN